MNRRLTPHDKATRARTIADASRVQLERLEARREASLEGCGLTPSPGIIDAARLRWETDEAIALAAERAAGSAVAA
jgi:hypothetical protein